ncbi:ABC transporter permease subunit [Streptomonospora salina]|uniref:Peptide/nickel transport system permease protein n=1 Tax=Streptomonospora salina TaxID=104205 RepID=A0A841ECC9_9ACTN|nr:ABC transporter permease subunit [Streptomonospora salina]MBB6000752.1 peptide/nickel transport system permease protein [Streptomonospora salina]
MRRRAALPLAMVLVPAATGLAGPLLAPLVAADPGPPFAAPGGGYPLGTDRLGRDVLTQLLLGGRSVLAVSLAAVALAYAVGGAIGLAAAAARRGWADAALLRPLDVVMGVPSLLMISVVAVWWSSQAAVIAAVVAVTNAPGVARLVRAAALDAVSAPVFQAMRLQGESRARLYFGYVGRRVLRPVAADTGTRITAAIALVASANFLGLGPGPTAPDWAVAVAHNRTGLTVQPLAPLAPVAMLVSFTVGLNLLWDRAIRARTQPGPRREWTWTGPNRSPKRRA